MDIDALEEIRGHVDALSLQRLIFEALVAGAAITDDAARAQLATTTALRAFGHGPMTPTTTTATTTTTSGAPSAPRLLQGSIGPELDLWFDHLDNAHDSLRRRGVVKASTLAALRRLADEIAGVSEHEQAVLTDRRSAITTIVDDRRARGVDVDDDAVAIVLTLLADLRTRR